jgi:hypothetical protein
MTAIILPRRTMLASAVAALGLASGGASAFAEPDPAELQIVDRETGEPLRIWRRGGRGYVAGQPGARYALRVANRTGGRVMLVLSVDGVNVVTGETASYSQNGYVLDPYESYDITGWRKSQTEVAAFAFAPLSASYAARTGRPNDVGVIGMAVFREKYIPPEPPPPMIAPQARDDLDEPAEKAAGSRGMQAPAAAPPPASAAAGHSASRAYESRQDERLGTAHGAREWSQVNLTTFERATRYPAAVRQIEYDTYAHLVARGVIPRPWREPIEPRPFPRSPGDGFVPDPPG